MTGEPAPPADPPIYIGFWLRMVAFIIDNIWIVVLLAMVVPGGGGDAAKQTEQMQKMMTQLQRAMNGEEVDPSSFDDIDLGSQAGSLTSDLLVIAGIILAFALCWWITGTTPGKWLIRAKVVDATTLKPPSFGHALVRSMAYYVSLLTLCLGFIWIGLDRKKRGFHDLIAGTVVVRKSGWFSRE